MVIRQRAHTDRQREYGSSDPGPGTDVIQGGIHRPRYTDGQKDMLRQVADSLSADAEERSMILENLLGGYHQERVYDLDPEDPFVSYEYHLNSLHVKYNMNHPFMKAFMGILDSIAGRLGVEPKDALAIKENRDLRVLFDVLMASLGQAKKALGDPGVAQEIDLTFDSLVTSWGDLSRRYTAAR